MPHVASSAFPLELTALFAAVQQHFRQVIVPLWQGPGWNAELELPYEALSPEHRPWRPSAIAPWPAPVNCIYSPA